MGPFGPGPGVGRERRGGRSSSVLHRGVIRVSTETDDGGFRTAVTPGKARILSATLSERWGRLFVSFSWLVEAHPSPAPTTGGRAGVDLGLRVLATVADDTGTITHVAHHAPLRATLTERGRVGRQLSRRIPGSHGHRAANAKLAGWTAEACTCAGEPPTSSRAGWRAPTARW